MTTTQQDTISTENEVADVPQRVLPHGPGDGVSVPESQQQQEQDEIVKQLQDGMPGGPDSSTEVPAGDTEVSTEVVPGQGTAAFNSQGDGRHHSSSGGGNNVSTEHPAAGMPAGVPGQPPLPPPPQPQQQLSSNTSAHSKPWTAAVSFSWRAPFSRLSSLHIGRHLQQDQQQQGQTEALTSSASSSAAPPAPAPPDAEAVPLLGPPSSTDPSTALPALDFVPQCPAGTLFSSSEGACVSRADAFASSSSQETPQIHTVTIAALQHQQACTSAAAAAAAKPLDPGTAGTVVLGPDGVTLSAGSASSRDAVDGSATASVSSSSSSSVAGTGASGSAGPGVSRAVAAYDGPVSQVSRTLTMIGTAKSRYECGRQHTVAQGLEALASGAAHTMGLSARAWRNSQLSCNLDLLSLGTSFGFTDKLTMLLLLPLLLVLLLCPRLGWTLTVRVSSAGCPLLQPPAPGPTRTWSTCGTK